MGDRFSDMEHLHGKANADDARWNTGLSAGNVTDTKGNVRPNRMLRQATNRGPEVMGSDSWGQRKYGVDMNGDPIEK